MRRILLLAILTNVLTFLSMQVQAEEARFSFGINTWYNEWSIVSNSTAKSDPNLLIGPSFVFSYGKFSGSASFMMSSSDYEFSNPSGKTEISRKDFDLAFGYEVNSYFSLSGGLKYLNGTGTERISYSATGGTLSGSLRYPYVFRNMYLIPMVNGSLMALSGEVTGVDIDIIGYSFEVGLAFALLGMENKFLNDICLFLGYKFQRLEWKDYFDDEMKGFELKLLYRF